MIHKLLFSASLLILSFSSMAQWYEATGEAQIRYGDIKSAKNRAIQDAVKQTMLFSGANVASIQKLSKGLLVDEQIQIHTQGAVNAIEVVDEKRTGDTLSITIRADIFPTEKSCYSSDFGKKLAITQFPIQHWEQAKIGGVYKLEKTVPQKLLKMLKSGSNAIYPVPWLDKKISVDIDFEQQGKVRYNLIDTVATQANTQFVLFGRITDISMGEQLNTMSFWQDDKFERYFGIDIQIANALTHEVLYQNSFHSEADWTYPLRQEVQVNSRLFWQSEYGHNIERTLSDIRDDIFAALTCQQLQSKILAIQDGDRIQLNLGRAQGITIGQEYRISYRADIIDDRGNLLTNFVISPYRVKITQVHENYSIAESLDADFMSNVQINDVVELKDWSDNW